MNLELLPAKHTLPSSYGFFCKTSSIFLVHTYFLSSLACLVFICLRMKDSSPEASDHKCVPVLITDQRSIMCICCGNGFSICYSGLETSICAFFATLVKYMSKATNRGAWHVIQNIHWAPGWGDLF